MTTNPTRWIRPSRCGDILLPLRTNSRTTNTILPPSSAGIGSRFTTPRLTLSSAAIRNIQATPSSSTTSSVAWAMPTGPVMPGFDLVATPSVMPPHVNVRTDHIVCNGIWHSRPDRLGLGTELGVDQADHHADGTLGHRIADLQVGIVASGVRQADLRGGIGDLFHYLEPRGRYAGRHVHTRRTWQAPATARAPSPCWRV